MEQISVFEGVTLLLSRQVMDDILFGVFSLSFFFFFFNILHGMFVCVFYFSAMCLQ